ncbi:MAG: DUF1080 domain-containing protein, partial [Planctomycetaceae bacterium]|nr:DUF1080 domain-containing protein [Planctomycetaceae bacterium]
LEEVMNDPRLNPKAEEIEGQSWKIVDDTLICDKHRNITGNWNLIFGDKNWSNFDLHAEVATEKQSGSFGLHFLYSDRGKNAYTLRFGPKGDLDDVRVYYVRDGDHKRTATNSNFISRKPDSWANVDISVRGSDVLVKVNGKRIRTWDAKVRSGRIGCYVDDTDNGTKPMWRNIEIRHQNGKLLWRGLPIIPDFNSARS